VTLLSGGTYSGDTYASQESLPIELIGGNAFASVNATGGESKVTVQWSTSKETSNTGFAILRSTSLTGTYTQINGSLVASQGDTTSGHSYSFEDTNAQVNIKYYYKVRLIPSSGAAIEVGPVTGIAVDTAAPDTPSVSSSPGNSQVILTITGGNSLGDLDGYRIYRSTSENGTFALINTSLASGSYTDTNVLNGFKYYYKVKAVDLAGNESSDSNVTSATPTPSANSSTYVVAFEDMKGVGNNDWDYNDFVTRIHSSFAVNGSNEVTSITINIEALGRGAGYVHEFWMRVPNLTGGYTYTLAIYDRPGGTELSSVGGSGTGTAAVRIWENTKTALPAYSAGIHGFATNSSPDQPSHTQGQAAVLTITLTTPASNPLNGMASAPFDPYLKIPYLSGQPEVHRVPYCTTCQETVDTAAYSGSSMFGSNLDFVLVVPENQVNFWKWPEEAIPVWNAYSSFSNYILSGKTTNTNWYESPTEASVWQHYTSAP
jgi:LruC domain-containing protein